MSYGAAIAAGIGALGSVAGGLLSKKNEFSSAEAGKQLQFNYATSPLQGKTQGQYLNKMAQTMGIHPIVLAGQPPMQGPIMQAGGGSQDRSWVSDVGQNIGRAVQAYENKSEREKQDAINKISNDQQDRMNEATIEGQRLQNALLTKELVGKPTARNAPGPNDLQQMFGQGDGTIVKPKEITPQGNKGTEVGDNPASQWFNLEGNYFKGMSERFADSSEEDLLAKARYWKQMLYSEVAPYWPPKHIKLKPGKAWKWVPGTGYIQIDSSNLLRRSHKPVYQRKTAERYLEMGGIGQ